MNVFDWVRDEPFIPRSGLFQLFKPCLFITSSLFVHLMGYESVFWDFQTSVSLIWAFIWLTDRRFVSLKICFGGLVPGWGCNWPRGKLIPLNLRLPNKFRPKLIKIIIYTFLRYFFVSVKVCFFFFVLFLNFWSPLVRSHLFDHLLWSIFRSSWNEMIFIQALKLQMSTFICTRNTLALRLCTII